MSNIAVIGMGQGGMTAAIKLARAGYSVTVYEREKEGEVSYPWKDDIRSDVFEITSMPMPDESIYCQKSKWLFVSPNEEFSLPVPPLPPMQEISIDRRGLSKYFATLALEAGVEIHYSTPVESLLIEDDTVKGVVVSGEEKRYDLVIDASGMGSPFRAELPAKFGVQAAPGESGVLHGYRAFYEKVEGASVLEEGINSTVVLKQFGERGISWCNLNEEGEVDVLIARLGNMDDEVIDRAYRDLKKLNPILSDKLLRAYRVDICLRSTISVPVADGYVAIGDSAFMPMPLLGSGIESAMKAGNIFAEYVIKHKLESFSAKDTWGFFVEYMKEIGHAFALIDVLKGWALSDDFTVEDVNWVFGSGVVEKEDLLLISTDTDGNAPTVTPGAKAVFKKIKIAFSRFSLVRKLIRVAVRASRAQQRAKKIPRKYNAKRVIRWAKKYDKSINAL